MYFLAYVLLLVGVIWITVNAAKKDGAVPAILCFLCGIYTIYYGIKNFAENKIPLILFIVGLMAFVLFRPDMSALTAVPAV
jgi:intracellular septation protein A